MVKLYRHLYDAENIRGIKAKQDAKIAANVWPEPDTDTNGNLGWWIGVGKLEATVVTSENYPNQNYNYTQFSSGRVTGGQEPVDDKMTTGFTYNYDEIYGKGVYLAGPSDSILLTYDVLLFEFDTKASGELTGFMLNLTNFDSMFKWDMGDGTVYYIDNPSKLDPKHSYADNSLKTLQVWYSGTKNWDGLELMYFYNMAIQGTLDISMFGELGGTVAKLALHNNPELTTLTLPTIITGSPLAVLSAYNCDLTGNLNISMFDTISGGDFDFSSQVNALLTGVTFASSITGTVNRIMIINAGLTGTLDVSMFDNLSTDFQFRINNNAGLTSITFPSSQSAGGMYYIDTSNTGISSLDLSWINNWSDSLYCNLVSHNCPTLSSFTPPTNPTSARMGAIQFHICPELLSVDISWIKSMRTATGVNQGTGIWFYDSTKLATVTMPAGAVSGTLLTFYAYNCDLSGTLDLSWVGDLNTYSGSHIRVNDNAFTQILLPTGSGKLRRLDATNNSLSSGVDFSSLPYAFNIADANIELYNNGMNSATVDSILIQVESMTSGEAAGGDYTGRVLDLRLNAIPGSSGITAKDLLVGRGWNVQVDI